MAPGERSGDGNSFLPVPAECGCPGFVLCNKNECVGWVIDPVRRLGHRPSPSTHQVAGSMTQPTVLKFFLGSVGSLRDDSDVARLSSTREPGIFRRSARHPPRVSTSRTPGLRHCNRIVRSVLRVQGCGCPGFTWFHPWLTDCVGLVCGKKVRRLSGRRFSLVAGASCQHSTGGVRTDCSNGANSPFCRSM
jgi:hypothetical protein